MQSLLICSGGGGRVGSELNARLVPSAPVIDKHLKIISRARPSNTTNTMSDSDAEGGVPLIEPAFNETLSAKKRRRDEDPEVTSENKKAIKRAKRKEKKKQKAKAINEDDLDVELGVNHAFERMDAQLLADYINSRTRHYGKDLSSVELEDKFIPGRYLIPII